MDNQIMLQILNQELAPAVGCTEPIAVAYASANAREVLGRIPDSVEVRVSRNIMKNAMGVGIPGTNEVGIAMACAMGTLAGRADAGLEVLKGITADKIDESRRYADHNVSISLKPTDKKLYIEVLMKSGQDTSLAVIEDFHTNLTHLQRNGEEIAVNGSAGRSETAKADESALTVRRICDFVEQADLSALKNSSLSDCVRINWRIAEEGIRGKYGMNVGSSIRQWKEKGSPDADPENYAIAMTAAAADARMAGSTLSVMTLCGSGNQGLTATVPVIAFCKAQNCSEEKLYRSLALSCLITIHVKYYIGRLSPLCGCGVGSSIGVCCALAWLGGGRYPQIVSAIKNMAADVSGIICDGAKAGCALKIATVIGSAFQCSLLALHGSSAGDLDGIVTEDVERTIRHIGELGNVGMADTDQVILDMMTETLQKCQ
ncbi:MAG: serine dehydratase subunit alpha family protein [Lachnospiraceae bacterium]|jgi:L-cysteine desulfidase